MNPPVPIVAGQYAPGEEKKAAWQHNSRMDGYVDTGAGALGVIRHLAKTAGKYENTTTSTGYIGDLGFTGLSYSGGSEAVSFNAGDVMTAAKKGQEE